MNLARQSLVVLLAMAALAAMPPGAKAQVSCERLWVERNSIYKARGYCFKTTRAIAYFGNAGCMYDVEAAVPLSSSERARIGELQRLERASGCR